MRHAHHDAHDALVNASVNKGLHSGDEGLASLETESLLVGVFACDKFLEKFGPHSTIEDHALFLDSMVPGARDFDSLTNPFTLVLIRDVNILDTDRATCI
jgi:hypothetical protein